MLCAKKSELAEFVCFKREKRTFMIEMGKFLLDRIHTPPWCPTVMKDHLCGGGNFQHVSLVGGFSPTHLKNISSQIGSFPPKGMKIIKSIKKPPSSSTYPATGNESTSPTDSKWKFGKSFDSKSAGPGMGRCDRLPGRYQPHYHQHC